MEVQIKLLALPHSVPLSETKHSAYGQMLENRAIPKHGENDFVKQTNENPPDLTTKPCSVYQD